MRTFDFHKNQPEPVCRHCGLEKDDHRKVQVLDESVYGSWGADYYCPDTGTEFEAAQVWGPDIVNDPDFGIPEDEDEPECECIRIDVAEPSGYPAHERGNGGYHPLPAPPSLPEEPRVEELEREKR